MRNIGWMASALLLSGLLTEARAQEVIGEVETLEEVVEPTDRTPMQQVQALKDQIQKENDDFFKLYQAAATEEERSQLFQDEYVSPSVHAPKFWQIADAYVGTEASLESLLWLLDNSQPDAEQSTRIVSLLSAHHMDSERIGAACPSLRMSLQTEQFLRAALEQSPFHSVRGQAAFALASCVRDMADMARSLEAATDEGLQSYRSFYGADLVEEMAGASPDDLLEESEFLFEDVVADYGDLPHYKGSLAKAAESELFEMRNLAVGMTAPEIEGEDIDGTAFKLSDYRGKVIMLDFWGHW